MFSQRKRLYQKLEKERESKVIAFITGDRPGLETQISNDAYPLFAEHLDKIGVVKRISLVLHTLGGDTMAAWSIISLIRHFCDAYEVVVPLRAQSAGTLMCLGAEKIIMTKQAMIGPIDPSVNNPLNPIFPKNPQATIPVSVEQIQGYFGLASEELGITDQEQNTAIFLKLAEMIHPLVLGQAFRARSQIQALARKLLTGRIDDAKIGKIVAFLCSDSGSHDYPIHRREAREHGLPIETPSPDLYTLIMSIFRAIDIDVQTSSRLDPSAVLGGGSSAKYEYTRALVESVAGGSHAYLTEGEYSLITPPSPPGQPAPTHLQDKRLFDGWRHATENPKK